MLVALVAGLYLLRVPILTAIGRLLVVDDAPHRADVIYLLNGDFDARAPHAAKLYRDGLAPRVLIAREQDRPAVRMGLFPNGTDVAVGMMRRLGVPDSAIVMLRLPGGATSTTDEGRALRDYLARHPARRGVIVVTSDYHTRRARWNMRRELEGVQVEIRMSAAPNPHYGPHDWWRSEEGLILYAEEYMKFVHNWIFR